MQELALNPNDERARLQREHTVFAVILAISFCHLLNDMMQSLLPAIYPNLKADFGLSFGQIGIVTLVYQITASILQPLVGLYADRRPTPLALPGGTLFSLAGLMVLSVAHGYGVLLVGASLLGVGSSVFHPESSRVARMAAGGRHGLGAVAVSGRRQYRSARSVRSLPRWSWCDGDSRASRFLRCWRCYPLRSCGMWESGTNTTVSRA